MPVKTSEWLPAPRRAVRPTFAIGDTHGHLNRLKELHGVVEGLLEAYPTALVVHLGDYIDRGPRSIETLEEALGWSHPKAQSVVLPGNHEQIMRLFLLSPKTFGYWWYQNGGIKVVDSLVIDPSDFQSAARALKSRLGDALEKLKALPVCHQEGDYFFVHAGIPAGMRLGSVRNFDWMADPEISGGHPLWHRVMPPDPNVEYDGGVAVIHGHTITEDFVPYWSQNEINIDTGSFLSGLVTMVELVDDVMRFHVSEVERVVEDDIVVAVPEVI